MSKKKTAKAAKTSSAVAPYASAEEYVESKMLQVLQNVQRSSLAAGAIAMCKVIRDKATDESKTIEERLADVVAFCETSLNKKESEDAT